MKKDKLINARRQNGMNRKKENGRRMEAEEKMKRGGGMEMSEE